MISLNLFTRLKQSSTAKASTDDLTATARDYRHKSTDIGGYWDGSFTLTQEYFTPDELNEFYNTQIGARLLETTFGIPTWEGQVVEMRYTRNGQKWAITLDRRLFQNRYDVWYSDDFAARDKAGWSENTDSSGIFGRSDNIESIAGSTSALATSLSDKRLVERAWPRSRQIGGAARNWQTSTPPPDQVEVFLAGYWSTLNWRYQLTTISAAAASSVITTLLSGAEFVTAGRIETNSTSAKVKAVPRPPRLGDAIRNIVQAGETGGIEWLGGVYENREFVYEPAPTSWTYQLQGDVLLDKASSPVILSTVKPGFLLFNSDAPIGWRRPGTTSGDRDDPQVAYVEEVEFVPGLDFDELRLTFRGVEGGEVVARQIREGSA